MRAGVCVGVWVRVWVWVWEGVLVRVLNVCVPTHLPCSTSLLPRLPPFPLSNGRQGFLQLQVHPHLVRGLGPTTV